MTDGESIHARRHPWAIALFWAWHAGLSALFAWPLSAAVGSVFAASPDGEAALWEPGGAALGRLFDREDVLWSLGTSLFVTFLVATALLDLVPIASLYARMALTSEARAPSLGAVGARGVSVLPTFATLLAGAVVVELLLALAAEPLGRTISHALMVRPGKPRGDLVALAAMGALGLVLLGVRILHDLARAAAVRSRASPRLALSLALDALKQGRGALVWSWAWRALAGLVPVAVGATVAARLGGRGGPALVSLAMVHQGALLARTGLRVSWMARALRAVARASVARPDAR